MTAAWVAQANYQLPSADTTLGTEVNFFYYYEAGRSEKCQLMRKIEWKPKHMWRKYYFPFPRDSLAFVFLRDVLEVFLEILAPKHFHFG